MIYSSIDRDTIVKDEVAVHISDIHPIEIPSYQPGGWEVVGQSMHVPVCTLMQYVRSEVVRSDFYYYYTSG